MKRIAKYLLAALLLLALTGATLRPGMAWASELDTPQPSVTPGMEDYYKEQSEDDSLPGEVQWYLNNRGILDNHDTVFNITRNIGWALTRLFCNVSNAAETLYDKTFGMIDLTKYDKVEQLLIQFRPALAALTVLCLMVLGLLLMTQREKKPVLRNIMLGLLAVTCSGWLFTTANSLVSYYKDGILGGAEANQSYTIVNENIIDLVRVDREGDIEALNYGAKSGVYYGVGVENADDMRAVKLSETLNWHSKKKGQKLYGWSDNFNNKIKYRAQLDGQGGWTTVENWDGLTSACIGNQFYYRYSFDFLCCTLQLISLALLFLALSYKNVRIAYELVVSRILAFMYAADVGGGEKLKNILLFIRDTYITLAVSVLCVRLYTIGIGYVTSLGLTGLAKGLVSLFITLAVIDGPNLIVRLLGMDAGLQSSFARVAAMMGVARGVGHAVAGGVRAADSKRKEHKREKERAEQLENQRQSEWNRIGDNNRAGSHSGSWSEGGYSVNGRGVNRSGSSGGGMDTSFMDGDGGNTPRPDSGGGDQVGSGAYESYDSGADASYMDGSGGTTASDLPQQSAAGVSGSEKAQQPPQQEQRVTNPAFTDAVRRLAPTAAASRQERNDFHRQVDAIVRGRNHRGIPPAPDAPEYQKRNYEKAQELEQAYRAYDPSRTDGAFIGQRQGSYPAPAQGGADTVSVDGGGQPASDLSQQTAGGGASPAPIQDVPLGGSTDTAFMSGGGQPASDLSQPTAGGGASPAPTQDVPLGGSVDTAFMDGGSVPASPASDLPQQTAGGVSPAPVQDVPLSGGTDTAFMSGSVPASDLSQQTSTPFSPAPVQYGAAQPEAQPVQRPVQQQMKPERVVNPAFRDAVKRLTPPMTASQQEKKDFHRQVNAVVRGKRHRAMKPAADAPEYQKRNYDKALELEQAYRAYKPEKQDGGGGVNGQ